jgi:cation:H+ antiporter
MIFYILVFIVAFIVLARSSDFLIRSLTGLARLFSLSEYTIAFIFMSMATSVPELFVGLSSAVKNIPEFSLGTVLGSNLVNITLVLGLIVFLGKGLSVESKISRRNFWIISGLSFVPFLLAVDGVISRGDGIILLLLFVFYISQLRKEKEYFTKTVNDIRPKEVAKTFNHLFYFFAGVGFLILSSFAMVWSGQAISEKIGISILSFSIIFAALGTSLPELAFGIRARMLKHDSMAVGNSLGSNAFNSTLIIGLVSLVRPIRLDFSLDLIVAALFLFLGFIFFNIFVYSKSFISRKEGAVLIGIYILFLILGGFKYLV